MNQVNAPDSSEFDSSNTTDESIVYDDLVNAKFDESVTETNKWDYIAAASSGVLSAAFDILWVGEFSLSEAQSWGKKEAD